MTKRKKARRAVVAEAAAAVAALWQQQAPAADNASSRIVAPADRSTAPVVGLLPEAAQLGCLPGSKTAHLTSSLVGSLVGSTRWSSATGVADCPCVWDAVSFSLFARTPQNAAANNTGRKNQRPRHPGKSIKDQGPTNRPRYKCFDP